MIALTILISFFAGTLLTSPNVAAGTPAIHHILTVEIDPETHHLVATDTVYLPEILAKHAQVSFALNSHFTINQVELNGQPALVSFHGQTDTPKPTRWVVNHLTSALHQPESSTILKISYHGDLNNSPTSSGGLRFVRPDKTNGHIGPQGVYLTSETFWYPTWEDHLVTFDVTITVPADWHAITQGQRVNQSVKETQRTGQWSIAVPTEALTLAANHFVVQKKPWRNIQLATYLFPAEAHLAQQYLDASATYFDLYTQLLGPYPFTQFAVVENFFPSGLGMPSFTLLGQGIVRRGYTQPYSLGHEIVHSWLGNSVFNDVTKGNWVEGLTTYLANYYFDEATENEQKALKTRRRMMDEYNLYTTPEHDYPIRQFHHKETRIDNAVGYQKTALVFHMLRRELGDAAFFKGIRHIIVEGTGQHFEWQDLTRVFSNVAGQDLTAFFQQWVEQAGAPSVTLHNLSVQPDAQQPGHSIISGTILQQHVTFNFSLPIQVTFQDGSTFRSRLTLNQASQSFTLHVPGIATSITLDPEHHWLLRLQRKQLPPMLNAWDTATRRILVQAKTASKDEEDSLKPLMRRIQGQADIEIRQHDSPQLTEEASYLIVGTPARQLLESETLQGCNKHIQLESGRTTILNQSFEGPDMAFLINCPHPHFSNHTVSLFFGLSPKAIAPVSRLLFYYGWDSYVVFEKGKVVARGMFQPVHSARQFTIPAP